MKCLSSIGSCWLFKSQHSIAEFKCLADKLLFASQTGVKATFR